MITEEQIVDLMTLIEIMKKTGVGYNGRNHTIDLPFGFTMNHQLFDISHNSKDLTLMVNVKIKEMELAEAKRALENK